VAVFTEPDGICIFTTGVVGATGFVTPCTLVALAVTKSGSINTGIMVGVMVVQYLYTEFRIEPRIVAEVTASWLIIGNGSGGYQ
jgi:hypothetical protein